MCRTQEGLILENPAVDREVAGRRPRKQLQKGSLDSSAMIIPSAESFPASDTDTESPFQLYSSSLTRRFLFVQSRAKIHTQALCGTFLKREVKVPLNAKYFVELTGFDLFLFKLSAILMVISSTNSRNRLYLASCL